jgi:predicted nucleic acid-binding Zn ribbon protein
MFDFGWLFLFMQKKCEQEGFELMPKAQGPPPFACAVCGAPAKTRFCSNDCRLTAKVLATRRRRPLKDHVCKCGQCGKSFQVGRRRKIIPGNSESRTHEEVR